MQFSKWVFFGFTALCLVLVAAVLQAPHMYYMAALLLTLPGVSYALGWQTLRGLSFSRELPGSAWEGEEGDIVYRGHNSTRVARLFLSVSEDFPDWIEPVGDDPTLFNLPAEASANVASRVRFRKRGVYGVTHFDVTAMDPLGVVSFTRRVPCNGEIVVYPTPQAMRDLPLSGAEQYGWQEFTAQALRGSSVDPDGVRAYVPGDPLRRIHWRQTARTGQLSVIEFEESQAVNLVIVLDLQRGTDVGVGADTTLEYAVRAAASAAQVAVQQGASVRLVTPRDFRENGAGALGVAAFAGRGQEHLFLVLDALARVESQSEESAATIVAEDVGELLPGTTLLVLTASPSLELPAAIARYSATGANVIVAFFDPAAFAERSRSTRRTDEFFSELLAVRARPYRIRPHKDGALVPEVVADVQSLDAHDSANAALRV